MNELLVPLLKQLANYLPDFVNLVIKPKTIIVHWINEAEGDLIRPFTFVALSVSFGFLLQLPQIGNDHNFAELATGMSIFKVFFLVLCASTIHLLLRIVGGKASFPVTLSAYLYIVSPLYVVGIILNIASIGVLRDYSPVVATNTNLDFNYLFADSTRWQTFNNTAPRLALAYTLLISVRVIMIPAWFITCWGAFRQLHSVSFWRSVTAGIAALIVLGILFSIVKYFLLGMFGTSMPALQ